MIAEIVKLTKCDNESNILYFTMHKGIIVIALRHGQSFVRVGGRGGRGRQGPAVWEPAFCTIKTQCGNILHGTATLNSYYIIISLHDVLRYTLHFKLYAFYHATIC